MQREKIEVGVPVRRALTPTIRSIDENSRTITFVASDESVDRYGDVIRVSGWKYENYLRNPVVLWGHRSGDPPIGKCVDLKIESKPPALVQTIEFADAKTYPFADTIFRLYKGGFMRAVSVGFMPTEQPMPRKDEQGNFAGYEFNGQELLELSAVPIPGNQNALARVVAEKGFSESDLQKVFAAKSSESTYRELSEICLDLASIAIDIAINTVHKALATIKAQSAKPKNSVEPLLTKFIDPVKEIAESVALDNPAEPEEITTVEQLNRALGKHK